MIVDTSALLAILLGEPEADDLTLAIARAEAPPRLPAASYVETGIRIDQAKTPPPETRSTTSSSASASPSSRRASNRPTPPAPPTAPTAGARVVRPG